jgi:transposase-like protein
VGAATDPGTITGVKSDSAAGDFKDAFAAAPVTVDATYTTPDQSHIMMEPPASIASWDGDELMVWTSTQMVDWARSDLAETFGIPKENVRVSTPYVGGGFGAKLFLRADVIAAALGARAAGRPVKVALQRPLSVNNTVHRPATIQRLRIETVRRWCKKFGESFADCLRRRRSRPGDRWHLDEVFIRIQGVQHYLWRAVDQDGVVLDILVQPRRDARAATRFFRRLLKGLQYVPRVIVTDKLRSYGVAQRQLLPKVEHRQSRYLNNRAENSHRPTRRRERQMQRFKSRGQAQGFLLRALLYLRAFSATTTPTGSQHISCDPDPGIQCLAPGHVRPKCSVICAAGSSPTSGCPTNVNVTMPPGAARSGSCRTPGTATKHPRTEPQSGRRGNSPPRPACASFRNAGSGCA